jgi:hypothetical protein
LKHFSSVLKTVTAVTVVTAGGIMHTKEELSLTDFVDMLKQRLAQHTRDAIRFKNQRKYASQSILEYRTDELREIIAMAERACSEKGNDNHGQ